MNLSQKIESYLFYLGESVSMKKLAGLFDVSEGDVRDSLAQLEAALEGRGIILLKNDNDVMLATHPEMGEMIQDLRKQELSDPLSKAAMETLAIVLYKEGATKPEIDFIRGVNSGFMLRNLLVRGLIEKIPNTDDKRVTKYRATFDTLRYFGVSQASDLPNFSHFQDEIAKRQAVEAQPEQNVFTE